MLNFKLSLIDIKIFYISLIRMAKRFSYQKSLKTLQHNSKKIWKMINEIKGKVKFKDIT